LSERDVSDLPLWRLHREGPLPAYTVRVSPRAKRVRIEVTPDGEVVVVIPRRFPKRDVPAVVRDARDWILKTQRRLAERRRTAPPPAPPPERPDRIELAAIGETWTVEYEDTGGDVIRYREADVNRLRISGPADERDMWRRVLRRWLLNQGRRHLGPWLRRVSAEHGLPVNRVTFRDQKTRWGSCSEDHNISLNVKLLLIRPRLVRYVFIHELCHTIHGNHSKRYWRVVERHEPAYREREAELKAAWHELPRWCRPE
jgi:hypothetical protein